VVELLEQPNVVPCGTCNLTNGATFRVQGRVAEIRDETDGKRLCTRCALRDRPRALLDALQLALRAFLCHAPLAELALPEMAEVFVTDPSATYPSGIGYYVFGQLRVFLVDPTFPIPEGADHVILFYTEVTLDGEQHVMSVTSDTAPDRGLCTLCGSDERLPVMGVRGRYDIAGFADGRFVCWSCVRDRIPGLGELYHRLQRPDEPRINTGYLS
jgi:hypothetical protein